MYHKKCETLEDEEDVRAWEEYRVGPRVDN